MSLSTKVTDAVTKAFTAAGDLVGDFTLRKVQKTFDPATTTTVTVNADTVGKGVVDDEKIGYMDRDSMTNQYITIWLQISVEPEVNDVLIDVDSSERLVLEVNPIRSYDTAFLYEVKVAA